jgi:hypothetical protein
VILIIGPLFSGGKIEGSDREENNMFEKQPLIWRTKPFSATRKTKRAQEALDEARRLQEQSELETLEFIKAIDRFKRKTCKPFPSWSEILEILKSLGYRKGGK